MSLRTVSVILAAGLALCVAMFFRKALPVAVQPSEPAPATVREATATPDPESPAATPTALPTPAPAAGTALRGLRLLSRAESEARGWSPPPKIRTARELAADAVWAKWAAITISLNYVDQPLADVLADLRRNYGLEARIDPELAPEDLRVTYRADGMTADQALMNLVLTMIYYTWVVDANGTLWITTEGRIRDLNPDPAMSDSLAATATFVREATLSAALIESRSQRRAGWMKDRTVTATLASVPLKEALEKIAAAGGFDLCVGSNAAEEVLARAPPVTFIGENLPLEASLEQLLSPLGLEFDLATPGGGYIMTAEEVRKQRQSEDELATFVSDLAKEKAALSARKIRIEGKVLTLRDVAAQLEAQLGEKVRLMPGLESCETTWEADGLEQTAGEVLEILAKNAPLTWGWVPEMDPEAFQDDPRMIWLVDCR